MAKMRDNWSAVFKDAAGESVFSAGGYESQFTMDIKTPYTFLNKALVELSKMDQFGNLPAGLGLKNGWDRVSIDAPDFGIAGYEAARADVSDEQAKWAEQAAENEYYNPPASTL